MLSHTTRYILSLLLLPTALIAFSLTSIVWLMQALRFVDFIINRGLSVGDFLYLTVLILPSLLTIILPVALLIAVVFVYHKLSAESELLVMQAAGLSRAQLARPALIAGMIVMAVTYMFTLYLLPTANRQFEDMKDFLRDNYASVLLQEEVFNHPVDGMTVFIHSRNESGELTGILVHDNRNPAQAVTMMAESGTLVQTPSGPSFKLQRGLRQEWRQGRVSWLNFDSYNLDLSYYTEKKTGRARDESERYLSELWHDDGQSPALQNGLRAEAHRRILWPLFAVVLSVSAVALVTSGQFNRRGMWKRLCFTGVYALAVILGFFTLSNSLISWPMLTPVLYAYAVLLLCAATLLLLTQRSYHVHKTHETNA